jgi:diaminopimelate decarboxylase
MEIFRNTKPVEQHPKLNSPPILTQNPDALTTPNLRSLSTPYFLIDEAELRSNVDNLQAALNDPAIGWDNSLIAYSLKTNALPWLLEYFKSCGFYAEAASDDEYNLALAMGYDKDKIVYNGPCKTRKTFIDALNNGCIVNIDSQIELQWLREFVTSNDTESRASGTLQPATSKNRLYSVGIRVNFDLESHCPGECSMGKEGSRFGFCYENGELKRAIDYINNLDHVNLVGLHLHFGSKTRSLKIYRTLARVACEIAQAYQLSLKYVDLGGGFFGGLPDKPQFSDYVKVISAELSRTFDKKNTMLILEPGTSLVSSPFTFVTTVIDVKQTTTNIFVVTDGSRIYVDPLMKKTGYFFEVEYQGASHGTSNKDSSARSAEELVGRQDSPVSVCADYGEADAGLDLTNDHRVPLLHETSDPKVPSQVICGFTCMEFDRLFVLKDHPLLSKGDRIIYHKVGAYTMCLSPLFITNYPAVYVRNGEKYICVRHSGTVEDFIEINT